MPVPASTAAKDRIRLALALILLDRPEPVQVSIAALRSQIARKRVVPAAKDALLSSVRIQDPTSAMAVQLKRTLEEMQDLEGQLQTKDLELERLRAKKPKLSTTNETPTAKAKKAAKKTAQRLEKIAAIEQLIEAHAKAPVASESSLTEPHQILCSLVDYQRTATGSKAEKEAACHPSRLLPRIQAIQRSTCRLLRALADSLPAIVEPSLSPTSFVPTVKELMHWACATAVQMLDACQKQAEKHTSADLVPQIMQAMSSAVNAIAIELDILCKAILSAILRLSLLLHQAFTGSRSTCAKSSYKHLEQFLNADTRFELLYLLQCMTTALPPNLLSPAIQTYLLNGISMICDCYRWSTAHDAMVDMPGANARKDAIHLILPTLRQLLLPASLQRLGSSESCILAVTLKKAATLMSSVLARDWAGALGEQLEGEVLSLVEGLFLACDASKLSLGR